jgi:hypothetical protein
MSSRRRLLVALALVILPTAGAGASTHEVVIEATRLEPPVLRTTTAQRVTFANRSGRAVHIDFLGDEGQHHVVQVPGSIWAIFHRPGRHPYVVHFPTGGAQHLQGVVEVEDGPKQAGEAPTCTGVSVMGMCLER